MQHIGLLKFNPYFSQISRRIQLNRALCFEQPTDQGIGLKRRGYFSKTCLPRDLPIVLNVKPKMQLLNLTQQRNGGLTCTKLHVSGVFARRTPRYLDFFVYQHGAYKTELDSSDSTLSLNRFGFLWQIEFVKLPLFNYDPLKLN